jgi:flagellar hook-associated protein FlgK
VQARGGELKRRHASTDAESVNVSSSLSGMRAADLMMTTAADNTANLDTPDYHRERVDLTADPSGGVLTGVSQDQDPGVDLAQEVVTEIEAKFLYTANAKAIEAQRDTEQGLFDALA